MPTGYTATLYEGTEQSFEEFLFSCARAFGALVLLRDQSPTAPIPDAFEPDTRYADEGLAKAREEAARYAAMPLDEAQRLAREEFDRIRTQREEAAHKRVELEERYQAMLARARQWKPPTEEHEGLRDFMIQQLEESIRFDCGDFRWPEYPLLSGEEWLAEKIAKAERDIEHYTEDRRKQIERTESRNAWIKALRESVATGGTACAMCGKVHPDDIKSRAFSGCLTEAERDEERRAVERARTGGSDG